jgi:hypothetical protein
MICSVSWKSGEHIEITYVALALHNENDFCSGQAQSKIEFHALLLPSVGFERDKAQILENFWLLLIWQSWEMRLSQKIARISCFQPVWKYYKMNLSHNISLFPSPQVRKPEDM